MCNKPDTVLFIMKRSLIIALMLSFAMGVYAKGPVNIEGKTVPYVKIRDLQNQPIMPDRTAILSSIWRVIPSEEIKLLHTVLSI